LLNHQSPGPSIPRFNPHGYQAPPQERKKEEASPAKPFGVVKKRQEEKEMVDFKNFNIEDLLGDKNVEFRNPSKAPGGWLPLDVYDNKEMDSRAPKDWMIV
jgi:hypothetical protein